ncbi:hypothetical protein Moror_9689 [Moniliophthora roreri MCA 2997]|uniref:Uncharacterized protein n=1 Tax=Moniliophthora roreri (strain MCA 2997) TaxID=1381753 RepID=V2WIM6_MONRO|nr:hypothetical protein Moror_9689 [Moniliophthora roreri MCA 2997]
MHLPLSCITDFFPEPSIFAKSGCERVEGRSRLKSNNIEPHHLCARDHTSSCGAGDVEISILSYTRRQ